MGRRSVNWFNLYMKNLEEEEEVEVKVRWNVACRMVERLAEIMREVRLLDLSLQLDLE
jgi:hypothetical protein